MKVGFTGTRHGMTGPQSEAFAMLLPTLKADAFHHGDCVGADDEAATIAHDLNITIVCHPPINASMQACNEFAKVIRSPKTHFARNRDIVHETDLLIACPCDMADQPRGGTWYTIRCAAMKRKPTYIIWPDGRIEKRNVPE